MKVVYQAAPVNASELSELKGGDVFIFVSDKDNMNSTIDSDNVFIFSENKTDSKRSKIISLGNGQITERDSDWYVLKLKSHLTIYNSQA